MDNYIKDIRELNSSRTHSLISLVINFGLLSQLVSDGFDKHPMLSLFISVLLIMSLMSLIFSVKENDFKTKAAETTDRNGINPPFRNPGIVRFISDLCIPSSFIAIIAVGFRNDLSGPTLWVFTATSLAAFLFLTRVAFFRIRVITTTVYSAVIISSVAIYFFIAGKPTEVLFFQPKDLSMEIPGWLSNSASVLLAGGAIGLILKSLIKKTIEESVKSNYAKLLEDHKYNLMKEIENHKAKLATSTEYVAERVAAASSLRKIIRSMTPQIIEIDDWDDVATVLAGNLENDLSKMDEFLIQYALVIPGQITKEINSALSNASRMEGVSFLSPEEQDMNVTDSDKENAWKYYKTLQEVSKKLEEEVRKELGTL